MLAYEQPNRGIQVQSELDLLSIPMEKNQKKDSKLSYAN